jgi:hypothetical protein
MNHTELNGIALAIGLSLLFALSVLVLFLPAVVMLLCE